MIKLILESYLIQKLQNHREIKSQMYLPISVADMVIKLKQEFNQIG